jgi:hypothetical protein
MSCWPLSIGENGLYLTQGLANEPVWVSLSGHLCPQGLEGLTHNQDSVDTFFFSFSFFAVLVFEFRAYTLNHSINPFL